ncbi:MAG: hypothetical protein OHK0046_46140 [Anaerolineae bacterium]
MNNQERLNRAEQMTREFTQRLYEACGVVLTAIIRTEQLNEGMTQSRAEVGYRLDAGWEPSPASDTTPDADQQ